MLKSILGLIILSIIRRNEHDIANVYDTFSNLMRIATGGRLLNFGYWTKEITNPLQAQIQLTKLFGIYGSFDTAQTILDVGSGFSIPAMHWIHSYSDVKIYCLNISLKQLKSANSEIGKNQSHEDVTGNPYLAADIGDRIFHINSTSTSMPFRNESVDRIAAFESAQHFKPLAQFIHESKRILKYSGQLILAMPVIANKSDLLPFSNTYNLGILAVTWASEHYSVRMLESLLLEDDFELSNIDYIGENIYGPLAEFYIQNRDKLRSEIIKEYPKFLEIILYKSMVKMKIESDKNFIEYVLIRATKR
ncbi:MAG: class I SAM-dependent methyltransferase [Candidatus Nitrosocosmicus sp.]|nr:class I SAM-dependent methyltransferase [Candidatus Nitrosocosmicus sp.]MDN5866306.1 class I SAM-dependent methyltransferase [Candidatus Nitrosocosmicus sp.]